MVIIGPTGYLQNDLNIFSSSLYNKIVSEKDELPGNILKSYIFSS
jgi:hypothetical protein